MVFAMARWLFLLSLLPLLSVSSIATCASGEGNCAAQEQQKQQQQEQITTFTLYDNGATQGGVNVMLSSLEFAAMVTKVNVDNDDAEAAAIFAGVMSSKIKVSKFNAEEPVIADRAHREDGELITTFEQLLPMRLDDHDTVSMRRVYLIAEDLDFVWPFIKLGHRQMISPKVIQSPEANKTVVLESMSEVPRVFRILHMFTIDEATAIINNALNLTGADSLKRSTVGSSGVGSTDHGRTSHNAWDHESPAAAAMIQRSFQLTNIEADDAKRDGLQVVRYTQGQGYNTHPDYFQPGPDLEDFDFFPYSGGSNRFATVFMYLTDVEEGGFTVFPRAPGIIPPRNPPKEGLELFQRGSWERTVLEQCYTQLAVPAVAGTAALFYSITPDGQIEPNSHHAACPLTSGLKWGANIWIWNKQRYGDIRTGEERQIVAVNKTPQDIFISWEGHDNGVLPAGHSVGFDSYEYHRFKASYGSHKEKAISYFTVKDDNGVWEIKPPRRDSKKQANQIDFDVHNDLHEKVMIYFDDKLFDEIEPGKFIGFHCFEGHVFKASLGSLDNWFDKYTVNNRPIQKWQFEYEGDVMVGRHNPDHQNLDDGVTMEKNMRKSPIDQVQFYVYNYLDNKIHLYFEGELFGEIDPGNTLGLNCIEGHVFKASLGSLDGWFEEYTVDNRQNQTLKFEYEGGNIVGRHNLDHQNLDEGVTMEKNMKKSPFGMVKFHLYNYVDNKINLYFEGQLFDEIDPGNNIGLDCVEGHVFKASLGSLDGWFEEYTVDNRPNQMWKFEYEGDDIVGHDRQNHGDGGASENIIRNPPLDQVEFHVYNNLDQKLNLYFEGRLIRGIDPGEPFGLNCVEGHVIFASLGSLDGWFEKYTVSNMPFQTWKFEYEGGKIVCRTGDKLEEKNMKTYSRQVKVFVKNLLNQKVNLYYKGQLFGEVNSHHTVDLNSFEGHIFAASLGSFDDQFEEYFVDKRSSQVWQLQYDENMDMKGGDNLAHSASNDVRKINSLDEL